MIFPSLILKLFFLLDMLCCYELISKNKTERKNMGKIAFARYEDKLLHTVFVNRVRCVQGFLYVLCISLEPLTLQPLPWQSSLHL